MAKYKPYCYAQGQLIPVMFSRQIQPGTFEFTLNHLIDHELDLTCFDSRFTNDETGAPAFDPRILLKIIRFAYSRGITSSRKIARCCEENVVFMALSANSRPHFTTISDFISSMDKEAITIFREVLLLCDEMGLIGKEMFAIDGCKPPSNAAKEWSGTKADFKKKAAKMEKAIESMVKNHHVSDRNQGEGAQTGRDEQYVATLRNRLTKIRKWLNGNDDKPGKTGKPRKSNITDNDSAKMKTSKGVIQGYDGVTAVDGKHQIIVHAEAFGQGQEHDLLEPMIDGTRENFQAIGKEENIFAETKLAADSGFHSGKNMEMLSEQEIDAYVADTGFRKRDPRFADVDRYKERTRKERARRSGHTRLFTIEDFTFADDLSYCLCPAGKRLYRSGGNVVTKGLRSVRFKGPKSACLPCALRSQCLRHPERTEIRQVASFQGRTEKAKDSCIEKMKRKIDSAAAGRAMYAMRLAIAEPPFAHICRVMRLNRFTLRGRDKVNSQWNLFCIVHNLKKIHRYGEGFA
ncbi:MAG: transposase [Desulfobulbaceae bacterium DB1]|nr:MAG: transposase [Desulfobulbaceae bacterium DB1]